MPTPVTHLDGDASSGRWAVPALLSQSHHARGLPAAQTTLPLNASTSGMEAKNIILAARQPYFKTFGTESVTRICMDGIPVSETRAISEDSSGRLKMAHQRRIGTSSQTLTRTRRRGGGAFTDSQYLKDLDDNTLPAFHDEFARRSTAKGSEYFSVSTHMRIDPDGVPVSESKAVTRDPQGHVKMAHQRRIAEQCQTLTRERLSAAEPYRDSQFLKAMDPRELPTFMAEFDTRQSNFEGAKSLGVIGTQSNWENPVQSIIGASPRSITSI